MKNKIIYTFIIFLLLAPYCAGWGEEEHKIINSFAINLLPEEMNEFKVWKDYIIDHAAEPDKRRKNDSTEIPKHYIDLDYYTEFLDGNMIYEKSDLIEKYGDSIVTNNGILPWATLETLEYLRRAFKEKNRDKILIYATDLGHYVADGHQPMHTILNYDGQLTGQKGIHSRYEDKLLNIYKEELPDLMEKKEVKYIENSLVFIFNYLTEAFSYSDILFYADNFAFNKTGSRNNDDYYRLFWWRVKFITAAQFSEASQNFASLVYTAWVDAGKPDLKTIN